MSTTDSSIGNVNLNPSAAGALSSIPVSASTNRKRSNRTRPDRITNEGSVADIIATVRQLTGDWPRNVADTLFIDDPADGIHYFDRRGAAGLFGWLRSDFDVEWRTGAGFPTQGEFFAELERTAPRYDAIELLPHEPLIDGIYYRGSAPTLGDGAYLSQLLDRFNPETAVDRDLIQAAFMTPFWGGPPGRRPAFVITSDAGRGAGKSTIPELVSYLCGGHIDVSAGGDIEQIKTRMLTTTARTKCLAVIDNVKSLRFSWAEFEAAITSPIISGRQLYVGEGQRPNLLTWFITLNGISLATDIAQRAVIIKIAKANYAGSWLEDTYQFIDQNRDGIIGDIMAALRSEPYPLSQFTRWAAWENGVLAHLPEPSEAQRVISERQTAANVELDEAEIIEEYFASELSRLGYDPVATQVRIPVAVVAEWFKKATGDTRIDTSSANKKVRQMITEGQIKRLVDDPGRSYGRGFIWTGDEGYFVPVENDLPERLRSERVWQ